MAGSERKVLQTPRGNDAPEWTNPAEILESIGDAFYAVDAQWRFVYVNAMAQKLWGRRADELLGKVSTEVFPMWIGSASHRAHEQVLATKKPMSLETKLSVNSLPIEINIFPRGDGLSVYFRDITGRKKYEEHLAFTTRELSHRTKNILAVVQAMIRQISQRAKSLPEFEERLYGCISALAHCHDLLVVSDWQGADLRGLVKLQIAPFGGSENELDASRFTIEGEDVSLTPQAAQVIALALHELATNAAKHGALSNAEGSIAVSWVPDGQGGVTLKWREHNGPPVQPPSSTGFGHVVLKRMAASLDSKVSLEFPPEGAAWTMQVDVKHIVRR